jgi:cystathionine beta-lyase
LAGLQHAHAVIPNERIRDIYKQMLRRNHMDMMNPFGIVGTEAAYKYGAEFLDELLEYLHGNLDYVIKFVSEKLGGIEVVQPEGTYLVWLDCRELGIDWKRMDDFFLNQARVALDHGHWFGEEGNGYMRLNIACPRSLLEEAMEQIEFAMQDIINWSGLDNL